MDFVRQTDTGFLLETATDNNAQPVRLTVSSPHYPDVSNITLQTPYSGRRTVANDTMTSGFATGATRSVRFPSL